MAVRTFKKPTSLEETLASGPRVNGVSKHFKATMSREQGSKANGSPLESGTFVNQDKLPKLPIPDLESTCEKYLASLKPLQSHREHRDTTIAVQQFLKADGPELNERLKKYATGKTSYIEQFCKYHNLHALPRIDSAFRV